MGKRWAWPLGPEASVVKPRVCPAAAPPQDMLGPAREPRKHSIPNRRACWAPALRHTAEPKLGKLWPWQLGLGASVAKPCACPAKAPPHDIPGPVPQAPQQKCRARAALGNLALGPPSPSPARAPQQPRRNDRLCLAPQAPRNFVPFSLHSKINRGACWAPAPHHAAEGSCRGFTVTPPRRGLAEVSQWSTADRSEP